MNIIREVEYASNGVGRKALLLDINPESIYTIDLYVNRNVIEIGILDFCCSIIYRKEKVIHAGSAEETADIIGVEIEAILEEKKIKRESIVALGAGMPGIVDIESGRVILSAQLGWKNVDFAKMLESRTGFKVVIDNDVKMKALAESTYGIAKNSKKAVLISIGSGVGSAFVYEGHLLRGEMNIAGEVGHLTVEPDGMLCECGRRGCLQTLYCGKCSYTGGFKG